MICVYVVEDNALLLEDILFSLNEQGFDCHGAVDAMGFDELVSKKIPDVVILDWNLSGQDGLTIAQRIHENERTNSIGIVFLSAKSRVDDRLSGLEFADAFLTKPVNYQELGAVIRSTFRRLSVLVPSATEPVWKLHQKTLNLCTPENEVLSLSYREYIVLRLLSMFPGEPIAVKDIVEAWGEDWLQFEKNKLELLVSRLRRKIKNISSVDFNPICSVRNGGYRLMLQIEVVEQEKNQNNPGSIDKEKVGDHNSTALSDFVYEFSPLGIMITGKNNEIIRVNSTFSELTGYPEKTVLGKNPSFLSSGRHSKAFYQQMWNSLNKIGAWSGEIFNRRQNGAVYLQGIDIKVRYNSKGQVENYIASFSDITQVREKALHLKHLYEYDELTALPNKYLLQQKFNSALATAKRQSTKLVILVIDLNDFKTINDKFGYAYGDIVLKEIAARMRSCIRETDFVARVGIDEFVCLMTNIQIDGDGQVLSEKFKKAIAQIFMIEDKAIQVSASIGSSVYPEHGTSFDELSSVADRSKYYDKQKMKAEA
ncbi:MAG: diguanylate cyclase [Methylococcaceae bacterium]|nr:diguanylate cyclase [Methylococcaceae bacterium]